MKNCRVANTLVPAKHKNFWKRILYGSAYGNYAANAVLINAMKGMSLSSQVRLTYGQMVLKIKNN